DTSFSYPSEHSMIARRSWTIYMVLAFSAGTHVWQIDTEPSGSGVTARALVSNNSGTVTGMATGGGGAFASSGPQMENVINTPAIYGLFWSRMDFLLGKSSYWPTCDDWGSKISQGDTYGNTEPLCLALNTDDLKPPEASSN
ncbi:MAG: hypothetical protein VX796_16715, partial [Pseudomonadota bacterium]|nr:hypothetical protein [Pseudomonadota bacterium]